MKVFIIHGRRRQSLTLDKVIGRGGEGTVYDVPDMAGAVAKIYNLTGTEQQNQIAQRRTKIQAMLAHPPRTPSIDVKGVKLPLLAWPTHLLETQDSCGFLMTKVPQKDSVSLERYMLDIALGHELTPEERCLTSRLFLCRSLSGVLTDLHRQGHYVVDFKPQNLRVFRNSCIPCFLDNDSFSISGKNGQRLPATVFSPDYAAPELLAGKSAGPGGVNDQQDRFALAVLLFQILNRGFHPFQGILKHSVDHAETTLDAKIRRGLYPYGLTPDARVDPCEGSDYDCLPEATRRLFDSAFQSAPAERPTARQWRNHFEEYLRVKIPFKPCEKHPQAAMHIHFVGYPCGECRRQALIVIPKSSPEVIQISIPAALSRAWKERVPWRLVGFVVFVAIVVTIGYYSSTH